MTGFYRHLISLKKQNKALWNGDEGGPMVRFSTGSDSTIFAFSRQKDDNKVVVFLNLSKKNVAVKALPEDLNGEYTDYFGGTEDYSAIS